ncbi:MAG: SDR family NAD(P)-dependent oxidoreductase, partial [Rhodococcus sp.]|nr:SDR family NAD(P)-dependent oxidoreductase [Rhodococcus sp. (in: high G+C Gram-positive bacteria)]
MTRHGSTLPQSVIAITGGARGIGREIAQTLAARGARVAIGDIEGASEAASNLDGDLRGFRVDVTD